MQVLARLGLGVVEADLVQDLARDVERERGPGAVQAARVGAAPLPLPLPRGAQADLLEHADQQLVHVVLDARRGLDVLAVAGGGQRLAVCNTRGSFRPNQPRLGLGNRTVWKSVRCHSQY